VSDADFIPKKPDPLLRRGAHLSRPGNVKPNCCVSSPFREDNQPSSIKDDRTDQGGDCLASGLSKKEAFRSFCHDRRTGKRIARAVAD
jgi:hypothetical protein